MIAIQKFDMHLDRPEQKLRICGVQGDVLSRAVCFLMHQNNRDWTIPENIQVAVWYVKSDRTGGMYDALPDGSPAWKVSGSALTVFLAPQMFAAAGEVQVQLELRAGEAVLHSFAFSLEVSRSLPLAEGSQDYFCWKYAFLPQTAGGEAGQVLQITAVDARGRVTQVRGVELRDLGEDGATFYPAVSQTGDLSWTNDRGLENPAPVNIKGPQGDPGPVGADGKSAYAYAQDAGYTGTEEEFADKLAADAGGSSVRSDWSQNDSAQPDYVKNRTHWSGITQNVIEWDANGDYPVVEDYCKISDLVPAASELIGAECYVSAQDGTAYQHFFSETDIVVGDGHIYWPFGRVVLDPPELAGTYVYRELAESKSSLSVTYSSGTIHTLDEKFIPDTIARVADIPNAIPMPPTAAVGQFIVVSAVDENGKVTATQAIADASMLTAAEGVPF
jgi:hypothetical protein